MSTNICFYSINQYCAYLCLFVQQHTHCNGFIINIICLALDMRMAEIILVWPYYQKWLQIHKICFNELFSTFFVTPYKLVYKASDLQAPERIELSKLGKMYIKYQIYTIMSMLKQMQVLHQPTSPPHLKRYMLFWYMVSKSSLRYCRLIIFFFIRSMQKNQF